ncbi:cation diffusion facilitator family transporter [Lapillicoccus sp.]|uniref:cation diffusion facilitator family transporter n=1 Tax=Lapillicoccus sp. TaxID=1909287 RepID=UPI0025FC2A87|nr:cation diffusion facilitator family transporter [Lapillicoccus sp.]
MSGHTHGASGHSHTPASGDHRRRLVVVLSITTLILVVEVVGAVVSGSLALLADAGHMLTDAAGLLIALIAANLALRPATLRRTWGYARSEVLAATLQAAILLAVGGFVLVEGVRRLVEPPVVASGAMVVFGAVGLVGNLVSMAVLLRARSGNLNMRAALLEVANDALGSVAVLVAALVIALTGWQRADAVVSILIGLLIIPRTLKLLRETVEVLLEGTPRGLDLQSVREHLLALDHVTAVHDLHASQISSGLPVLSAHVVVEDSCFLDGHAPQMLDQLQACVAEHFEVTIEHSTFQLEPDSHTQHEATSHA